MSSYWETQIGCPFYRDDEPNRISCEGVGEASATVLWFRFREERNRQIRIFCAGSYVRCEVYRMLMEKYED